MSQEEIYDFIEENLTIDILPNCGSDYGRRYQEYHIQLCLRNPKTNIVKVISTCPLNIDSPQEE